MYEELYALWKKETESAELIKLPSDFYSKVANYLRRQKEESRMLDRKTVKATLLQKEMRNAKRMIHALSQSRCRKLAKMGAEGKSMPSDLLTKEEEKFLADFSDFTEIYASLASGVLVSKETKSKVEKEHARIVLRFLREVPTIVGADMQIYGPFKVEDIAAMPVENAKILAKQGLAGRIEIC